MLLRRLIIAISAIALVTVVFVLYTGFGQTGQIQLGSERAELGDNFMQTPTGDGRIGDTGVGTIQRARFTDIDEQTNRLIREFGFEEVLYAQQGQWHIIEPYIIIYEDNFTCYVRSEAGVLQLEDGVSTPNPDEIKLVDRVTISIVSHDAGPEEGNFIFLEELLFEAEKSKFSSAGPVKFVSAQAIMNGTGMELVYNQPRQVLEYFRVNELHSLRLKTDGEFARAGAGAVAAEPADAATAEQSTPPSRQDEYTQTSHDGAYVGALQGQVKIETDSDMVLTERLYIKDIILSSSARPGPDAQQEPIGDSEPDVAPKAQAQPATAAEPPAVQWQDPSRIDTDFGDISVTCRGGMTIMPHSSRRQLWQYSEESAQQAGLWQAFENVEMPGAVFAAYQIEYSLADQDRIFAAGENRLRFTGDDADTGPVRISSSRSAQFDMAKNRAVFDGDALCVIDQADGRDYRLSSSRLIVNLDQDSQGSQAIDDIVAEDNVELEFYAASSDSGPGHKVFVSADQATFLPDQWQAIFEGNSFCRMPQPGLETHEASLRAQRIIVEMTQQQQDQATMVAQGPAELQFYIDQDSQADSAYPVNVTAADEIRYDGVLSQLIFTGDCRARAVQQVAGLAEERILKSPRIVVQLDRQDQTSSVRHIRAAGQGVELSQARRENEQLVGFVKITSTELEYDLSDEKLYATGPGEILLDNSQADQSGNQQSQFALSNRCYGSLRQFDWLSYCLVQGRLAAAGQGDNPLDIRYIPVTDDGYGRQTIVTARKAEGLIEEDDQGNRYLAWLLASDGISYEEAEHYFIGSQLLYQGDTQLVKVSGSQQRPCLLNGARVDGIEYDLSTGRIRAQVPSPGWLSITE